MTAEEIFHEVLKSPELQKLIQVEIDDLEQENFHIESKHPFIEIIKTIIDGQETHRGKDAMFQIIQKQIIQL